jgi:hypothetical protein
LIRKERIDEDLDLHRRASGAAVQPEPLETDVVFNGGFPALRKAVFWVRPALPVVVDISVVQTIAVEGAEASVCSQMRANQEILRTSGVASEG